MLKYLKTILLYLKKIKLNMPKITFKTISLFIYQHLVWIFLILSIILLWLSHADFITYPQFKGLLNKLGLALFSSGVFAAVLKSIQFTGIFKEELEKIILGTDFIENRKDLDQLWRKISKSIYKSKFPQISEHLEERILKTYFPTDYEYYYEDYVSTINIHDISEDLEITYTQTVKFNVILDKTIDSTVFKQNMKIDDADKPSEVKNDLKYFKVNGEKKDPEIEREVKDQQVIERIVVPLKGAKIFKIESRFERKYSLKGENFKLLRFNTFTKNVDVFISYPKNISVSFFNVGNVNFFEEHHTDVAQQISRSHRNDVILPYQGFGMSFDRL